MIDVVLPVLAPIPVAPRGSTPPKVRHAEGDCGPSSFEAHLLREMRALDREGYPLTPRVNP